MYDDEHTIEIGTGTEAGYQYDWIHDLPTYTPMKIRVLVLGAKKWIWINDIEVLYNPNMGVRHEHDVDFYFNYGYLPGNCKVKNLYLLEVNFVEFTVESGEQFIPAQHSWLLMDDLILEKDFEFECEVQINNYAEGDRNIFRFSNTNTNEGYYGDRTLMVNTWNYGEGNEWIDIYTDS